MLSIPRDLAVEIPGRGLAKINETYTLGGLDLTARTIKGLLSTDGERSAINHAVATTFGGFVRRSTSPLRLHRRRPPLLPLERRAAGLRALGGDRRRAGYQGLCGTEALEYVRFRHLDNDIVRAARQQDFLRAAKDQLRPAACCDNLRPLARIIARATETDGDLQTARGMLRLASSPSARSGKPVRADPLPGHVRHARRDVIGRQSHPELGSYVTASPSRSGRRCASSCTRRRLDEADPRGRAHRARRARKSKPTACATRPPRGEALVAPSRRATRTRMPIYAPRRLTQRGASRATAPSRRTRAAT